MKRQTAYTSALARLSVILLWIILGIGVLLRINILAIGTEGPYYNFILGIAPALKVADTLPSFLLVIVFSGWVFLSWKRLADAAGTVRMASQALVAAFAAITLLYISYAYKPGYEDYDVALQLGYARALLAYLLLRRMASASNGLLTEHITLYIGPNVKRPLDLYALCLLVRWAIVLLPYSLTENIFWLTLSINHLLWAVSIIALIWAIKRYQHINRSLEEIKHAENTEGHRVNWLFRLVTATLIVLSFSCLYQLSAELQRYAEVPTELLFLTCVSVVVTLLFALGHRWGWYMAVGLTCYTGVAYFGSFSLWYDKALLVACCAGVLAILFSRKVRTGAFDIRRRFPWEGVALSIVLCTTFLWLLPLLLP